MPRLSETLSRLAAGRGMPTPAVAAGIDRLSDLEGFGRNPGNLRARIYVPSSLQARPALVVVLHGCTQNAAGYDTGSGWSRLADEQGFVLLFPEQKSANNPNRCFNWFAPEDVSRDHGEAQSIREMIAAMIDAHAIDPARVFVNGLSAGGAMTAVMLAQYPEVFAGGAIIGGLPYGTASGVMQAMERMRGQGMPDAASLGTLVRDASAHRGGWPTLSVWHGDSDATVQDANAEAILTQWRVLHGVDDAPTERRSAGGDAYRVWRDAAGRPVIEDHRIAGMGHGTPIATRGAEAGGTAGAFMLDVGISSTRRIAAFWGIAPAPADAPVRDEAQRSPREPRRLQPEPQRLQPEPSARRDSSGVAAVIDDALRAAGLLR
ncbi:poly(hydroxyalkanoate) depolymerase family esterase [Sphingomonas insulae]|uniref:PHB depolymerase family esterase n=1 Tax=Sphingomonas insulae TaxID=424800 RepID=A0ABP3T0P6_9SPHN|nr:PHB depolymerase family esterase [Sphingomonas insulae]NIJ29799.1 poly(hydroxyalkanoate) depolymerase family esterase [Sphingomonas insulae]